MAGYGHRKCKELDLQPIKGLITCLHHNGVKFTEIAKICNCSPSTITLKLKNWGAYKPHSEIKRAF